MALPDQPSFFDPAADFTVSAGRLPHWEQAGVAAFITFRTWDSMPAEVIDRLIAARSEWLRTRGINPERPNWEYALNSRPAADIAAYRRFCSDRWDGSLDRGYGSCPLRRGDLSAVVAKSLRHFDGVRYVLYDYVVMPNHAHVLAAFPEPGAMRAQCGSWKHFTATRLNKALGRTGRFWQDESFDHLTRSDAQFERYREYIADNPAGARLRPGEFAHYSRGLAGSPARVVRSLRGRSEPDRPGGPLAPGAVRA